MASFRNCPSCHASVEDDAHFCGVCGAAVEVRRGVGEFFDEVSDTVSSKAPTYAQPRTGDPLIGVTLGGRFEVIEKLGEGGFGAVYRATQVGIGREVAVKVLHPNMTKDSNVLARFRREGEMLCTLRDAHTITTYDFSQAEDGTLYIAMELLRGRSLHEVFRTEAPIEWSRVLKIVSQMCSSLEEAHQNGIIHRDLKPENIYLENAAGNEEFVKILDFGIAKMVGGDDAQGMKVAQLTATGQTLGTLEYMSPEQLMGKALDGRSDVYAVGVLIYELMTGQLPFPDAVGPAQLIACQLKKPVPPPSTVNEKLDIPVEIDALVLKCLGKRKDDRYSSALELRKACDELLAALAPVAPNVRSVRTSREAESESQADAQNTERETEARAMDLGGEPKHARVPTVMTATTSSSAGTGFPVAWLVVAAIVAGTLVGAALAFQ